MRTRINVKQEKHETREGNAIDKTQMCNRCRNSQFAFTFISGYFQMLIIKMLMLMLMLMLRGSNDGGGRHIHMTLNADRVVIATGSSWCRAVPAF